MSTSSSNTNSKTPPKRSYKRNRRMPVIEYNNHLKKYVEISTGNQYEKDKGDRVEVLEGIAYRTKGLLTKEALVVQGNTGKILSKTKHESGKEKSNLDALNERKIEEKKQRLLRVAEDITQNHNHNTTNGKQFTFREKNKRSSILKCDLESRPCQKAGCAYTNDYPIEYCIPHLRSEMGLCIGPSTLKLENGKELREDGLFACHKTSRKRQSAPVFNTGASICVYTGSEITSQEVVDEYLNNPHSIMPYSLHDTTRNKIIDASCVRGIGAFANHKPTGQCNAQLVSKSKSVILEAIAPILDGDEIFVDYGYDPVVEFSGYTYNTKQKKQKKQN